jgi:hypothetical protein
MNIQDLFWHFVQKREDARVAKEAGQHPHTDDPVIQQFVFCNINREHDRVTRWIAQHVRGDFPRIRPRRGIKTLQQLVFHVCVARVFNEPLTLQEILGLEDTKEIAQKVLKLQAAGKRIFRGAYMMPSHGSPDQLKMPPAVYYMDAVDTIWGLDFSAVRTLADLAEQLAKVPGFGPFLVNQVVTDMRYTKYLYNAPDWQTFVLGGPGTSRGLCRFFGEPVSISRSQKWMHPRLMHVRDLSLSMLPIEPFQEYFLDPNNLSNSFCEFDKYARVVLGEGRNRKHYKPTPNH